MNYSKFDTFKRVVNAKTSIIKFKHWLENESKLIINF